MPILNEIADNSLSPMVAFKVGNAVFDPERRCVMRGDREFDLEPKVSELLVRLAQVDGVVRREDLLDALWGADGSDEALTQTVSKLRRALGDTERPYRIIETVPKLGYRMAEEPKIAECSDKSNRTEPRGTSLRAPLKFLQKGADFYYGAAFGAVTIILGLVAVTFLSGPRSIEQEIECPDHWASKDCIALIEALKP